MSKITELYAFIVDDEPDNEGIMQAWDDRTGLAMPFVTSKPHLVRLMDRTASAASRRAGKPYRIAKFLYAGDVKVEDL